MKRSFLIVCSCAGLLLSGCLAAHEQVVHSTLSGDMQAVNEVLIPGMQEADGVVHLESASPACPGYTELTPLQAAACVGNTDVAKRLLALGANPENAGTRGSTPLMFALAHQKAAAADVLLDAGAKVDGKSAKGFTPLMLAAMNGMTETAKKILRAGASPKAVDGKGRTALLLCADPEMARMLVALGSDPLARDAAGATGLHIAAGTGNASMVRFFLEQGIDPSTRDKSGATALAMARGTATATQMTADRVGRLAGRLGGRGAPQGPKAAAPEKDTSETVEMLSAEERRLLAKDVAAAETAGRQARSAEAFGLWANAIGRAADLGKEAETETTMSMLRYANALPVRPGLPEKAREHIVRAQYLLAKSKNPDGAARELRAALAVAPWWADSYHDLGMLESGRGNHDEGTRLLRIFLAAAPNDPKARAVRDRMVEIDLAKEQEAKVRDLKGSWTDGSGKPYSVSIAGETMTVSGNGRTFTMAMHDGMLEGTLEGAGGTLESCSYPSQQHPATGSYDADARTIALDSLWSIFEVHSHCENAFGAVSNCCLLCITVCDAATLKSTEKQHLALNPAQR